MIHSKPIIAYVMPAYNEEETIDYAISKMNKVIDHILLLGLIDENSFMLFVDDGSSDSTWNKIEALSKNNKQVRGIRLSKNCGHQTALMAGLNAVKSNCDAVISIDVDLQQDPYASVQFIKEYISGSDVVLGIRNDRDTDSGFKRFTSTFFYTVMKFLGVKIVSNHADYRLLSNKANMALCEYQEPELFIRAAALDIGFNTSYVNFDVSERIHGESKYTLKKMLRLAYTGITSFSIYPLRIISIIGFFVFFITVIMGMYVLFHTLFLDDTIPGWASTTLPIYFLGGIQILCLGVFGEYLGRIYFSVKNRPRWFIERTTDMRRQSEES